MPKKIDCVICKKKHASHWGWRHKKWTNAVTGETVEGWGCSKKPLKHTNIFTPDRVLEDRQKHQKDTIQPFRAGQFSKEFKEQYPELSQDMVKSGSITKNEYKNAREVWK